MSFLENMLRAADKIQIQFEDWLKTPAANQAHYRAFDPRPADGLAVINHARLRDVNDWWSVIFLLLDQSHSMNLPDFKPSRLAGAKQAAIRYIATAKITQPQLRVGIISFCENATLVSAPLPVGSHDRQLIHAIQDIATGSATNIEAGLNMACAQFPTMGAGAREIILLSDGEPTDGDALAGADQVKRMGVTLNIIGIGGMPEDVNEPLLKQMASVLDGQLRYWFIRNVPDLVKRFEALGLRAY